MESQNENYGNQNHHDNKNHGAQEPIGISRSIISTAISKENSRKNTHTLQKLTMISNMESLKPRKNKNNLQSYD
jgi:hypothetical protein